MNNILQFITIDEKEGLLRRFHSYHSSGTNPTTSSAHCPFTNKGAMETICRYGCEVCGASETQVAQPWMRLKFTD